MSAKTFLTILLGTLLGVSQVYAATSSDDLAGKRLDKLETTVMNPNLPLEKRIRALRKLYSDQFVNGKIDRTFCIWDPLGKSGPIASAADDQKLRSLHYGMDLTIIAYQDEKKLVDELRSGDVCDAALISGGSVLEFNRFSGTIESMGGLPERQHLQLLMQVLASPKMADRLTGDEYVFLGLATIGGTYAFMGDRSQRSLMSLKNRKLAISEDDAAMAAIASSIRADAVPGSMMASVQTFADGEASSMISSIIAYLVMGSGQVSPNIGILREPLAQSTVQLIGRLDKFPAGLAQILREDFLFKFENYARRVDKEQAIIPENFWIDMNEADKAKQEIMLRDVRLKLRDQGVYDPAMLRLERKIRCKFAPGRDECTNPVE